MPGEIRLKLERAIRNLRVRRCPVPFVIWFRERSGSTHLCSVLNSHDEISCRGEDFNSVPPQNPSHDTAKDVRTNRLEESSHCYRRIRQFDGVKVGEPTAKQVVSHLHDIFSFSVRASGFKLKFPVQAKLFPEVMHELEHLGPNLRVIALSRRNALKQAISRQNMLRISAMTDGANFNLSKSVPEEHRNLLTREPFAVKIDEVLNYTRQLEHDRVAFEQGIRDFELWTNGNVLRINYEDLLSDERQTIARVLEFLDVDANGELTSGVEKATPDCLSDALLNFEELAATLSGTELEYFVSDSREYRKAS